MGSYDILHGQQLFDPLKCILCKKTPSGAAQRRPISFGKCSGCAYRGVGNDDTKIDNEDVERLIDIIGDGDLTAEAQERLHQEGLWPLYESLRQTAYAAFVFGHRNG